MGSQIQAGRQLEALPCLLHSGSRKGTEKMYMKISTANMGREEWLQLRKTGIGGSDAGAVCGMNPYSSPAKVFQDKVSSAVSELDSEAVRQGNDLEDYVAKRFMEVTGLKVRRSNYLYRSAEHPFMVADVDRLVVGEDAGLECKTASAYSAGQWKDGNIPLHYILQCMHYGSDIIGLNQKEPNSKGDAGFSPVLILS